MVFLRRSAWIALLFLPSLFLSMQASAQRLPAGVTPQHYALTFTPDLSKATFSGEETIDLQLTKASNTITLNAIELEIQEATITQDSKTQTAQTSFATEKEQATLTFADQ